MVFSPNPHLVVRSRLVVLRLVEEEVGSELFVLITGKVSLDRGISVESETAKLDCVRIMISLFGSENLTLSMASRSSSVTEIA